MKKIIILLVLLLPILGLSQKITSNEAATAQLTLEQIQEEDFLLNWTFEFDAETELPLLENSYDIIAWISDIYALEEELYTLYAPLEAYQWKATAMGNRLIITGK
jgi:hypothetical protein